MLLKTLILGLGNPILGDDGVGWRIVEMLRGFAPTDLRDSHSSLANEASVEFDCAALSGLGLMERMVGYHRVLLIDALNLPSEPIGTVIMTNIQTIKSQHASRLASAHDTTLSTALEIGRQLGAQLPREISILGINTEACFDFSESLSDQVALAIPQAVHQAKKWLSPAAIQKDGALAGAQV